MKYQSVDGPQSTDHSKKRALKARFLIYPTPACKPAIL